MSIESLGSQAFSIDASASSLPASLLRASVGQEFDSPLQMLRAVVLLGGSVRQSEFRKSIRRSILDLPVDGNRTMLDAWSQNVLQLADAVRWQHPRVRLLVDRRAPSPRIQRARGDVEIVTEPDPVELRGTGGILRDLSDEYSDNDYLLVANAAQVLFEPLFRSAAALVDGQADIAIAAHPDGSPSGLALIRCGALRLIRATGYVDFKEQALSIIAQTHRVRVKRLPRATAMPIRSLADYVSALRLLQLDRPAVSDSPPGDALEEGGAVFAVAEDPANVHPTAELLDSVVLRGARVDRNAVVVRSLVCEGAVVPAGVTVLNRVVTKHSAAWANEAPRKSWPFQAGQLNEFLA